ncbi:ribonuclease domain-containing protein [Actinocatenispora rupis]|uniref:Uncharacterized protein n=1 Tax=Actinocatenispora rupis TaxID=519421 RepID=A0A8J3NCX3_9ACTN|nr:ribonuclease domain-containing protein [Actinocatenispora rupis]GID14764.1 hypothetical protein Aru02nite_56530 [Actinocatenispora rupis]
MAFVRLRGVIAALALALVVTGCGGPATTPPAPSGPATASATPASTLPTVRTAELPAQARRTLALIDAGGPFPYRQDGVVFGNREHVLPGRPTGYYHEYTVPTPGASTRGARRLVTGQRGDVYYTADHYATFRQVLR